MIRGVAFSSVRRVSNVIHRFAYLGLAIAVTVVVTILVVANPGDAWARPAIPLGVAYSAPLGEGEWRLSYSHRRVHGRGLRKGSKHITIGDAAAIGDAADPPITQIPFEMDSDIHTLGLAHAPFPRLTLAIELPLVSRRLQQRDFASGGDPSYTTHAFGVGDLEIVAVVPFMEQDNDTLDFHFGLRFPTADISNKGKRGPSGRGLLPVSMQSGSRTTSVLGGLSFQGDVRGFGWGVNGASEIGLGDNSRGYRLGNSVRFTGWLAHDVTSWFSGSLRLAYDQWFQLQKTDISGPADHLSSYRSSTGGKRLALAPGVSIGLPGMMGGQRLSFEASWPIYRSMRGIQVDRDYRLMTGWEWIF